MLIPKTSNKGRLAQNLEVYKIKLAEEDYQAITKLNKDARFYDPKFIGERDWNGVPYFS